MSEKIKRYEHMYEYDYSWMPEADDGEYVKYSDYDKLQAEVERLTEMLKGHCYSCKGFDRPSREGFCKGCNDYGDKWKLKEGES